MGYFDLAIIETLNGGDLQLVGRDLAIVEGNENQFYLSMFGGNVEQDTENSTPGNAKDYWANNLLFPSEASMQFNSKTERILNTTELTSVGRLKIENAIKQDLKFSSDFGAEVSINVSIPETNKVIVELKATLGGVEKRVATITYVKKSNGDFFAMDFNNDFFI